MSIFQNSVLKTFKQDEKLVAQRWAAFQNYKAKVEAIKDFKEEEYQDGFLKDIFESCLGYTLKTTNPSSFNLEREKKNETDSKKADGVIYLNSEIIAVIELKDTKTKNLDRVQQQAFWYLTQHTKAKYVIISNFDELRFYFDKSTAYESFSLFNLSYDEFCKLHLLLSFENIKDETALKIKEKTNSFEQDISKKLYKDFSNFRTLLFENIVKNNLGNGILIPSVLNGEVETSLPKQQTLLRLTQKLCDRIIFILFAEDRDLLRANMIKEIREEFINQKFTNYSLYDIYKFYFEAINKGNDKLQIPQYNGGLFATDLLLDSLIIDDFILDENVQILSNYDFASEISVNILGHIFEQSLTDLEELQANIDNVNFDKTKSKRKKDGVFYTPEYITRYIVENTLGKMCSEKREELLIGNGILIPSNPKKLTKQEQQTKENLQEYKNWLLNLKILDPACGSGAFLNQALEYLISEHKNLQNDLALMGDLFASYMVEEEILEHNLYGVDINEDAVEIAKLSLWLRTAKRGRPLTKLADKIVCANSLLEMPFSENSFDIVIGNPPYGAKMINNEEKNYEIKSKESAILFMQLSLKLLKENGLHSFIIPKPFIYSSTWEDIKNKFKDEIKILIDCGKAWQEVKLEQIIYVLRKANYYKSYKNFYTKNDEFIFVENIDKKYCNEFGFLLNSVNNEEINIALKIKKDKTDLLEISTESNRGGMFQKDVKENGEIKVLGGVNVQRYEIRDIKGFVDKNLSLTSNSYFRENSVLVQRLIAHILYPKDHIKISGTVETTKQNFVLVDTVFQISLNNKYFNKFILSILHSKIMNWYVYRFIFAKAVRTFQFSNDVLKKIPIPKIDEESQKPFIKLVDEILEAKQKIKDYKPLLDEAIKNNNFDREIALKKELENLENISTTNEKTIDQMVYKLYDLTPDEIKIVEGV